MRACTILVTIITTLICAILLAFPEQPLTQDIITEKKHVAPLQPVMLIYSQAVTAVEDVMIVCFPAGKMCLVYHTYAMPIESMCLVIFIGALQNDSQHLSFDYYDNCRYSELTKESKKRITDPSCLEIDALLYGQLMNNIVHLWHSRDNYNIPGKVAIYCGNGTHKVVQDSLQSLLELGDVHPNVIKGIFDELFV